MAVVLAGCSHATSLRVDIVNKTTEAFDVHVMMTRDDGQVMFMANGSVEPNGRTSLGTAKLATGLHDANVSAGDLHQDAALTVSASSRYWLVIIFDDVNTGRRMIDSEINSD